MGGGGRWWGWGTLEVEGPKRECSTFGEPTVDSTDKVESSLRIEDLGVLCLLSAERPGRRCAVVDTRRVVVVRRILGVSFIVIGV